MARRLERSVSESAIFASSGKNVCVALIADTYIRDPAQGR